MVVFRVSRRNAVEGLDRLVTVGMTKDSPFGYRRRRSSSDESFGMESFKQSSQDKPEIRWGLLYCFGISAHFDMPYRQLVILTSFFAFVPLLVFLHIQYWFLWLFSVRL